MGRIDEVHNGVLREDWNNADALREIVLDLLDVLRDHAAALDDLQHKVGLQEKFTEQVRGWIRAPTTDLTPFEAGQTIDELERVRREIDDRLAKLRKLTAA